MVGVHEFSKSKQGPPYVCMFAESPNLALNILSNEKNYDLLGRRASRILMEAWHIKSSQLSCQNSAGKGTRGHFLHGAAKGIC